MLPHGLGHEEHDRESRDKQVWCGRSFAGVLEVEDRSLLPQSSGSMACSPRTVGAMSQVRRAIYRFFSENFIRSQRIIFIMYSPSCSSFFDHRRASLASTTNSGCSRNAARAVVPQAASRKHGVWVTIDGGRGHQCQCLYQMHESRFVGRNGWSALSVDRLVQQRRYRDSDPEVLSHEGAQNELGAQEHSRTKSVVALWKNKNPAPGC